MRQHASRWTVAALIAVLGIAVCAPPAMADQVTAPRQSSLTKLSPASLTVLRPEAAVRARAQQQSGAPSDSSFFGGTRGKIALGLMVVGVAFTVWTVHDSRKPVKSPVR